MKKFNTICMCLFILIGMGGDVFAKEIPFTLADRDRLIRVEAKLEEIDKRFEQIDKRFEQIDKRFEQLDKRFEQIDKRFEQFGKQIDQLFNFLWIFAVIFTSITVTTIGFAIWDRRSMIRPFEVKTKEIEERMKDLDEKKIKSLIESMRELAKVDSKVAEALKKFNLL